VRQPPNWQLRAISEHIKVDTESGESSWHTIRQIWMPEDEHFKYPLPKFAKENELWKTFLTVLLTAPKKRLSFALLAHRELRFKLSRFTGDPDEPCELLFFATAYRATTRGFSFLFPPRVARPTEVRQLGALPF